MGRLLVFLAGMLASLLLMAIVILVGGKYVAAYMVVNSSPEPANAIVVVGGCDGSCLHKGLSLYEQGLASQIIMVDTKKQDWFHITCKISSDCLLTGKPVTILEGSTSTVTDAELTMQYCQKNNLKSVLVVSAPYHTRRVQKIFADIYDPVGIQMTVVSSNDFGRLKKPQDAWWLDDLTLQAVWVEFGKLLYWKVFGSK